MRPRDRWVPGDVVTPTMLAVGATGSLKYRSPQTVFSEVVIVAPSFGFYRDSAIDTNFHVGDWSAGLERRSGNAVCIAVRLRSAGRPNLAGCTVEQRTEPVAQLRCHGLTDPA
jgi:hypothetical protein